MTVYHKKETALLRKIAQSVQHNLGNCFTRDIYMDALEQEFIAEGVPYTRNMPVPVYYGTKLLSHKYKADFFIRGKIIVMVRAEGDCKPADDYTLLTLLQATKNQLAILIQFRGKNVSVNRVCSYTKFMNSLNSPNLENSDLENADFESTDLENKDLENCVTKDAGNALDRRAG
jgi:GxxExxY protein